MQKEKTPLSGIVDLSDHLNLNVIKRNLHSYRNEGGGWEGTYDPAVQGDEEFDDYNMMMIRMEYYWNT